MIALAWAAASVLAVTWEWALPRGDVPGPVELVSGIRSAAGEAALVTALGAVLLGTLPWVVRGLVAMRVEATRSGVPGL